MAKGQFFLLSVIMIVLSVTTSISFLITPIELTVSKIEDFNIQKNVLKNVLNNVLQSNYLVNDWRFLGLKNKSIHYFKNKNYLNRFIFSEKFEEEDFKSYSNGFRTVSDFGNYLVSNFKDNANTYELYYSGFSGSNFKDLDYNYLNNNFETNSYSLNLNNLGDLNSLQTKGIIFSDLNLDFFNFSYSGLHTSSSEFTNTITTIKSSPSSELFIFKKTDLFNLIVEKDLEFFNHGFKVGFNLTDFKIAGFDEFNISLRIDCSSNSFFSSLNSNNICNSFSTVDDVNNFYLNKDEENSLHLLLLNPSNFTQKTYLNNGSITLNYQTQNNINNAFLEIYFLFSHNGVNNVEFVFTDFTTSNIDKNFENFENIVKLGISESQAIINLVPQFLDIKKEDDRFSSDWKNFLSESYSFSKSNDYENLLVQVFNDKKIFSSSYDFNSLKIDDKTIFSSLINSEDLSFNSFNLEGYSRIGKTLIKDNSSFEFGDFEFNFNNNIFTLIRNNLTTNLNDFLINQNSNLLRVTDFNLISYDYVINEDFLTFSQLIESDGVRLLQIINIKKGVNSSVFIDNFFSNLVPSSNFNFLSGNNDTNSFSYQNLKIRENYPTRSNLNNPTPTNLEILGNAYVFFDYANEIGNELAIFYGINISSAFSFINSNQDSNPYFGVNNINGTDLNYRIFYKFLNTISTNNEAVYINSRTKKNYELISQKTDLSTFNDFIQKVNLNKVKNSIKIPVLVSNFNGFSVYSGDNLISSSFVDDFLEPLNFDAQIINEENIPIIFYFFNPVNQSFWINHSYSSGNGLNYELINPFNQVLNNSTGEGFSFFENFGIPGFYVLKISTTGTISQRSDLIIDSNLRTGCFKSDWIGFKATNPTVFVKVLKDVNSVNFSINSSGMGEYFYELLDENNKLVSKEKFNANEFKNFQIFINERFLDTIFELKFYNINSNNNINNIFLKLGLGFSECLSIKKQNFRYVDDYFNLLIVNNSFTDLEIYENLNYFKNSDIDLFSKNDDVYSNDLINFNSTNNHFSYLNDNDWITNLLVNGISFSKSKLIENNPLRKVFLATNQEGLLFTELLPSNFFTINLDLNNPGSWINLSVKINNSDEKFFKTFKNVESELFTAHDVSDFGCENDLSYVSKKSSSNIFSIIFECSKIQKIIVTKNGINFFTHSTNPLNLYPYFGNDLNYENLENLMDSFNSFPNSNGISYDYTLNVGNIFIK